MFWAWTPTGAVKPGFPYLSFNPGFAGGCGGSIAVADVDGNGVRDILVDHNTQDANGQSRLFGVSATGQDLPGWPLKPFGFTYMNGPTFGDLNGDGKPRWCSCRSTCRRYVSTPTTSHSVQPLRPWGTYHQDFDRSGKAGGGRTLFTQGTFNLGGVLSIVAGTPGEVVTVALSLGTGNAPLPFAAALRSSAARDQVIVIPASGQIEQTLPLPSSSSLAGTRLLWVCCSSARRTPD